MNAAPSFATKSGTTVESSLPAALFVQRSLAATVAFLAAASYVIALIAGFDLLSTGPGSSSSQSIQFGAIFATSGVLLSWVARSLWLGHGLPLGFRRGLVVVAILSSVTLMAWRLIRDGNDPGSDRTDLLLLIVVITRCGDGFFNFFRAMWARNADGKRQDGRHG